MKQFVFLCIFLITFGLNADQTRAYSHFFDFFKNIKATKVQTANASPFFPWWHSKEINTLSQKLSPKNTPLRSQWQPKPVYAQYKPNSWYNASSFFTKKTTRKNEPIVQSNIPKEPSEVCKKENSILIQASMSKTEFTHRCCECNPINGKFECEYESYSKNKPKVCSSRDLEINFETLTEDTTFSNNESKRFQFTFSVKNHALRYSFKSFTIELFLGETLIESVSLNHQLLPLQNKTFSNTLFPSLPYGVKIEKNNKKPLKIVIRSEEEDPNITQNNQSEKNIQINIPLSDLSISAFSIQKNEENKNIQIITEIHNHGRLGADPASGVLHIFQNDQPTPIKTFTVTALGANKTITKIFSYTLNDPSALFSAKINADDDQNEKNINNNTFEQFFSF